MNGGLTVSPREILRSDDWRGVAVKWLMAQGVSTVLLFAILGVMVHGTPKLLDRIEQGYDRNATQLERVTAQHVSHVNQLVTQMREDHNRVIELLNGQVKPTIKVEEGKQ